ncbi:MAG TPA: FtsW/RodA/SpoVE family cell cycle protein [Mollicutes bacterium]|nr:FtsW/RodA/SpoVE family cell cycle protein [Mollicutes bacterium]
MRSKITKMDKSLLFWTIVMFVFGLFMIFSASSVKASLTGAPYYYFIRQSIILIICLIISLVVISLPLKLYKRFAFLFVLIILGSLVVVYLYGAIINRAKSWIPLGFFNYQPSEFAKTVIILYMAVYYNKNKDSNKLIVIFTPLVAAAMMAGLTFIQPDFGTAFIIVALTAITFFSIPLDKNIKKVILKFIGLIGVIVLAFVLITGNSLLSKGQLERLDYKQPCAKYLSGGSGYHVCNGFIAINNGGLWGVGLGNSTQKYLYLPEAHTDFIMAIILEELGLIVGIVIMIIYTIILTSIIRIAYRSHNLMGSVIAYGTAVYIFLHIVVNLTGLLGLLPLTGVPLPFLSYGGSYALNLAILLALVQRVEIENKRKLQERVLKGGKQLY